MASPTVAAVGKQGEEDPWIAFMLWEEERIHIVPLSEAHKPYVDKFGAGGRITAPLWQTILRLTADESHEELETFLNHHWFDMGECLLDAVWVPRSALP